VGQAKNGEQHGTQDGAHRRMQGLWQVAKTPQGPEPQADRLLVVQGTRSPERSMTTALCIATGCKHPAEPTRATCRCHNFRLIAEARFCKEES